MDKIVITGFGVKAPGVSNIAQFKDVLEQGICTQEILHGRGNNGSNIVCGVVHEDLDMINGQNYKRYPRAAKLGIAAAEEAFKMANLQNDEFTRVAVIMGTSGGGILEAEKFSNHGNNLKKVPIQYIPVGDPHTISSGITKHLGINGQAYTISTGCTASLDAILLGKLFLEAGYTDICIVGGSDALLGDWITYGFLKTGTIAKNVEIEETGVSFSTSHKGFVKSEGSAVVIMERKKDAESRGA
jgi:3-oxoacyl-(acyl-carrier-protein) synthase